MRFEEALKAMRAGKKIQIPSGNFGFFLKEKISKKGTKDLCLYRFDKRPNGGVFKVQRIKELNVHYITMFDWEVVEDVAED